ncbi:MAG: hypothetical protein QM760_15110 [Nibricoccus sp.]
MRLYQTSRPAEQQVIDEALNTADEHRRLSLLRKLQKDAVDDRQLQADIETLLPLVEQAAEGRSRGVWSIGAPTLTSTSA